MGTNRARRCTPPSDLTGKVTATLPRGRKGSSLPTTANECSTAETGNGNTISAVHCSREPVPHISTFSILNGVSTNRTQNSEISRHKITAQSTEETVHISVDETDSGNEKAKLTRISANADIKRIENSAQEPAEIPQNRTPDFINDCVKRGPEITGESVNNTRGCTDSEAESKIKHVASTHEWPSAIRRSNTTIQVSTVHQHSTGKSENKSQESTCEKATREDSACGHLWGRARTVQESTGCKVKISPQSSGKTQRTEEEKGRKTEDFVNKTNKKSFEKVRGTDPADRIEHTVCEKARESRDHTHDNAERVNSEGSRTKIKQDTTKKKDTSVQESSGEDRKTENHAYVKDGKEDYSAGDRRKRAHFSGYKAEQVESSASEKNKGMQHSSNGKVKRIDSVVSSEKTKRNALPENKSITENPVGSKDESRETSAQEVITVQGLELQDTRGKDGFIQVKSEKKAREGFAGQRTAREDSAGENTKTSNSTTRKEVTEDETVYCNSMSRRPQVLKIKDSATTASRPRAGEKHVSYSQVVRLLIAWQLCVTLL